MKKMIRFFVLFVFCFTAIFSYDVYFADIANATTFEVRINAGSNDAEQNTSSGFMYLDSSDLEFVNDVGDVGLQTVGMRFTNVTIPKGEFITNAYLEFEVDELDSEATNVTFYAQAIDDAPTFTTATSNISSRTKTTASVAWNSIPAWSIESEKKQTPNLASIIQEVVDRSGWASGNDIVIIVTGSGQRTAESYEGEPANAPLLHIEYSAVASGTPISSPAFFLMSPFYGADKGVDDGYFDESPIQMNDYGETTAKCEVWDCSAWSGGTTTGNMYCSGGWDCNSWNGTVCAQYTCLGWTWAGSQKYDYCSGEWDCTSWNGNSCDNWSCTGWTETAAKLGIFPSSGFSCPVLNGNTCDQWDCPTWNVSTIGVKAERYCSGVWDCTSWNGDTCVDWGCTAWTQGTVNYDYYPTNGWTCSVWNGNVCDQWQGQTWTQSATAERDSYCDRWQCTNWDATKKVCQDWDCQEWVLGGANDKDMYCSGNYQCTAWEPFSYDSTPPVGLTALTAGATTKNTQVLNWSEVTEPNFNHYEVWYGQNQSDVQNRTGTATEWDNSDDSNLATKATTTTTIPGLTENTLYYYKIWAVDNSSNEATVADINVTTASDTTTWPMTTAGNYTYNSNDIEFVAGKAQLTYPTDWWDVNYQYRKKITFGADHSTLPLHYTASVNMDTRPANTNVELISGNDVRIVWQPNVGGRVELNRIGDLWNNASSLIKFRLQSEVGANLTEDADGSYYVYYGYISAGTPPANEMDVFYFADYFNRADNTTVGNGWTEIESGGTVFITGNTLSQETNNVGPPDSGVKQNFSLGALTNDFTMEWDWTIPVNGEGIWTVYSQIGNAMSDAARETGVAFGLIAGEGSYFVPNNLYNMNSRLTNNLETGINGAQSYKLVINYAAKTFDYYRGGTLRTLGVPFLSSGTALSQIRLANDSYASAESNFIWDNVKLYLNVGNAPETALGNERTILSYHTDKPTIRPNTSNSVVFAEVTAFTTTEVLNGGSISYQVTNDGTNASPNWYYWNGSTWAIAGATDYNSASVINTNIAQFDNDIGGGNFSFKAFLISDGTQLVKLDNVNITYSTNTVPVATTPSSITQSTTGSGYITFQTTVSDSNSNETKLKVEYSDNGGTNWYDPDLASVQFNNGSCDLNDANTYQIGTVNGIDTDDFANVTLTIAWDTKSASNGNGSLDNTIQSDIKLRVTPNDGIADGTAQASANFNLDNTDPTGLTALTAGTSTSTTQVLNWSAVTETNFDHYEIWYGTNQSEVQTRTGASIEWDNADDANLANIATTSTTITGLSGNTTYYYKIWAVDDFGNDATVADINKITNGFSLAINSIELLYENGNPKFRIDYTLTESNSTACNFTTNANQVQYSTDLGGPWTNATIYGTTTGADSSPGGTAHTTSFEPLYWNASGVTNGDYYIQIKPHNGTEYASSYAVSGATVKVYTPTPSEIMRHGKFFLDGIIYYITQ